MGKRGDKLQADVQKALRSADVPLSAYDILSALRKSNPKAAPTTVYRALNSLMEKGEVRKLESLKTYVLCQGEQDSQDAIFSICDDCGSVEETVAPNMLETMTDVVGKTGFAPKRHVVEVHGTCAKCMPGTAAP